MNCTTRQDRATRWILHSPYNAPGPCRNPMVPLGGTDQHWTLDSFGMNLHSNHFSNESMTITQFYLDHCIPVTSALVGVQRNVSVNDQLSYDEVLISRRSRFRSGTRFTKRGADATGAVANYAETEQTCLIGKIIPYSVMYKRVDRFHFVGQVPPMSRPIDLAFVWHRSDCTSASLAESSTFGMESLRPSNTSETFQNGAT
jgi:hypothetical protein